MKAVKGNSVNLYRSMERLQKQRSTKKLSTHRQTVYKVKYHHLKSCIKILKEP
jgi:hypothetical protein